MSIWICSCEGEAKVIGPSMWCSRCEISKVEEFPSQPTQPQIIVSGADWTRDTLARAVATCAPAYLRWEWDEDHDRMIPFERHVHSDCPFDAASVFRMLDELGYMGYWVTVGDNPVLGCKDCQLARKDDPTFEISHFPGPILGWAVASAFVAARQAGNSANAATCPVSQSETAHQTVNSDPTKGEE